LTDFEDKDDSEDAARGSSDYYQGSLERPYFFFTGVGGGSGGGSDGSGGGRSPVVEHTVLSNSYLDPAGLTPLLEQMSQDSDDTLEERLKTAPKRSSGRHGRDQISTIGTGAAGSRNSLKLTPDLLPSNHYTRY
jgi:hypothetical protein